MSQCNLWIEVAGDNRCVKILRCCILFLEAGNMCVNFVDIFSWAFWLFNSTIKSFLFYYRFRWLSFRVLYVALCTLCSVFMTVVCTIRFVSTKVSFAGTGICLFSLVHHETSSHVKWNFFFFVNDIPILRWSRIVEIIVLTNIICPCIVLLRIHTRVSFWSFAMVAAPVVFFVCGMAGLVLFFRLSQHWPSLMTSWREVEVSMERYGPQTNLSLRFRLISAALLSAALGQYTL